MQEVMTQSRSKNDPRTHTKMHETRAVFRMVSCIFVDRFILDIFNSLCASLVLSCASVADLPGKKATTETQRTLRMHKENKTIPIDSAGGACNLPLKGCLQSGPKLFDGQIPRRENNDPVRFRLPGRLDSASQLLRGTESGRKIPTQLN